ncbi:MAG: hypothetical protein Q6L50_03140 [Gloeomargarita sp. GMQP_bins_120]
MCTTEDSRRVEPPEEQLAALLAREHIRVIVVITTGGPGFSGYRSCCPRRLTCPGAG